MPMPSLVFSNACQTGQTEEWRLKEDYEERMKAITQILRDHLKPDLLDGLLDKNDEALLDKTIEDILAFYDKTYAGR